ncbi:MAG: hypothetical protein HYV97_07530 [Bdellovibrio sp.]|nr:hypothetical protein [Bdellovibrio sp.]
MTIRHLALWSCLSLCVLFPHYRTFAHPHGTPVRGSIVLDQESRFSRNKGGYGYIASSEAEAVANMSFACTQQNQNYYFQCFSHGLRLPESWFDTYTPQYLQPIVLQRLREHMVEKIIHERAALSTTRGNWPTSLPSACMSPSSGYDGGKSTSPAESGRLLALHNSLPTTIYSPVQLTALGTALAEAKKSNDPVKVARAERNLDRANKFNSSVNSLSSGNIVRALTLHDQLSQAKKWFCAQTTDNHRNTCIDLTNQTDRIKDSYPILFQGSSSDVDARLGAIRNTLYDVLGAKSGSGSEAQRRAAGKAAYNSHTRFRSYNLDYDSFAFQNFEAAMSQAVKEAKDASNKPEGDRSGKERRLAQAFAGLDQGLATLKDNYKRDIESSGLSNICSLTLNDFFTKYPNVVRQAMADSPRDQQALMKLVYCQSGHSRSLDMTPQCHGVTSTNTADARVVSVNRQAATYPFFSATKYSITYPNTPVNAAPTLRMSVDFPTSIRPRDKFNEYLAQMQKNVNDFYNCSADTLKDASGARVSHIGPITTGFFAFGNGEVADPDNQETVQRKCPPHPGMPKVNFEITFVPKFLCTPSDKHDCQKNDSIPEPKMVVHQCYNAELKKHATDCAKVREHALKECGKRVKQVVATGMSNANADAVEFDDYLTNAIYPLSAQTMSVSFWTQNHCAERKITTPVRQVSECASISDDCDKDACMAQALCRMPQIKIGTRTCWTEDTMAKYCDGRLRTDGQPHPAKPAGHPDFNRQDAGNLTPSTTLTTFVHEIGHAMSTDDEYQDSRYPFLPQGEHDSIWNSGGGDDGRIYPRHINKILEPGSCP